MNKEAWVVQHGQGSESGGYYVICLTADGAARVVRDLIRESIADEAEDLAAPVAEALHNGVPIEALIDAYNEWHDCRDLWIRIEKAEVKP